MGSFRSQKVLNFHGIRPLRTRIYFGIDLMTSLIEPKLVLCLNFRSVHLSLNEIVTLKTFPVSLGGYCLRGNLLLLYIRDSRLWILVGILGVVKCQRTIHLGEHLLLRHLLRCLEVILDNVVRAHVSHPRTRYRAVRGRIDVDVLDLFRLHSEAPAHDPTEVGLVALLVLEYFNSRA